MMQIAASLGGWLVAAVPLLAAAETTREAEFLIELAPGAYEVEVRLELPNLPDMTANRTAAICLAGNESDTHLGLVVLSENNPLASCAKRAVARSGNRLTFDIACDGGNAATGNAVYTIARDSFQGRITMKMGGKNMTMTETQRGRRTGDCPMPASRLMPQN